MVQTMCAKLTLKKSKYDSTWEALAQLHWLPIKQRINFKIATITHKCLYGTAPQYLKDLLILAPTPRSLRSSNDKTRLIIPFTKCKTLLHDPSVYLHQVYGTSCWCHYKKLVTLNYSNNSPRPTSTRLPFIECNIIGIPGPPLHFSFQLTLVIISLICYNFNLSFTQFDLITLSGLHSYSYYNCKALLITCQVLTVLY